MISNQSTETVTGQQVAKHNDNLELYVSQIGKIFDVPHIINEPRGKQQIIDYYVKSKFGFMLASFLVGTQVKEMIAGGFYHYGISYDGKYKREDFKEQARIVEKYIRDNDSKNVLELACGMGGNIAFLARRNPHVMFDGIDLALTPLKRFTKIPNTRFQLGDYHDLSAFKDSAYDIVFIVEALCYSANKLQVLREVKKKLRRDGLFIVIDGYRKDRAAPLSPSEETLLKLVEMSWAIDKFESVKDVEDYMREEYSIAEANDLSRCTLPSIDVIARQFRSYFAHPMLARIVNKLLPSNVAKGFIPPYLSPVSIRRQIACYYSHVLKNNK